MRRELFCVFFMVLIFVASSIPAQEKTADFPVLKGPYLGQKPPGMTPEVFAPGVVSTDFHEFGCCFSPDGKEFYFTRRDPNLNRNVIMATRRVDGVWTKPEIAPFNGVYMAFEPRITPKGDRLYFTSSRSLPGGGPPMNIWYVERRGDTWGEPQNPGEPFNPMKTMYVSVTSDGTVYTTDISQGMGKESMAIIEPLPGRYGKMERLGPPISIGKRDMYPFITPDESCLIFCSDRSGGDIMSGLFVSFRNEDGTWNDPKPIVLGMKAGLPLLSPDGEYLFFTAGERGKSDIYWVDAKIIEELKPEELKQKEKK